MAEQIASDKKLTGRHVLLILFVFFGVMFAVNFYFVYVAISSYPGEDVKNPYTQGVEYNDTLAQRAAQQQLGWTAQIGIVGEAGNRSVRVRMQDSQEQGLAYLTLTAELRRTISDKEDQALVLEPLGAGDYSIHLGDLPAGRWELRLKAYKPGVEESVFLANKTLDVK